MIQSGLFYKGIAPELGIHYEVPEQKPDRCYGSNVKHPITLNDHTNASTISWIQ